VTKYSTHSILFAGLTTLFVLITGVATVLFCLPVTPGDTPTIISWNLTFVIPLLILSALSTLTSLIFLTAHLLSDEKKTLSGIGLPILLMLVWFIPPILSKNAEANFIRQTKRPSDPIENVILHRDDMSNLDGYHWMQLVQDTPPTMVVDRFIQSWEPGTKTYTVLQTKMVNLFDATDKKDISISGCCR